MNYELIQSMDSPIWGYFAALALLAVTAGAIITAVSYVKKKTIALALIVLIAIGLIGPGIWFSAHEDRRIENAKASVVDGFDRDYGLALSGRDLGYLQSVRWKDVTRNLKTADGNLKPVLFRLEDDKVLPYTQDSEGNWIPMPTTGETK